MATKKVQLNTMFVPQVALGETENHYGVPFTAVDSGEKNPKNDTPILILQAELDAAEADAMLAVGRVFEVKAPVKGEK